MSGQPAFDLLGSLRGMTVHDQKHLTLAGAHQPLNEIDEDIRRSATREYPKTRGATGGDGGDYIATKPLVRV